MLNRVVIISLLLLMFLTQSYVMSQTWDDWNKQGMDLYGKGNYEGAIKCYSKALEEKPSAYGVWYNKGMCYYKQGNFDKAVGCFNEALKYKGDLINVWLKKGLSLNELGKYSEAIKCFDYVLSKNPNDPDAKKGREEAKKKEASQVRPTPVAVDNSKMSEILKKANACYDKGEYDKAVALYDAVLVIDPNNKEAIGKKAAAEVLAKQELVTPTPISVSMQRGKSYTETGSGTNFDMVYIEGGTFQMGQAGIAEPVHTVTVSSFYIGKYEVRNREYLMYDPGHKGRWSDGNYPVECVSWDDATGYCRWLSDITGKNYRLPTEAEWEYACRAGSTTVYYWGDSINDSYCWYSNNSGNQIHPAGQKKPNPLGLFDMSGNAWEWCSDWNGEYPSYTVTDPAGPASGTTRAERSGGWDNDPNYCRSAFRYNCKPFIRYYNLGFCICRSGL